MFTLDSSSSITAFASRHAAALACCLTLACDDGSTGSARPVAIDSGAPLHWTRNDIVLQLSAERAGAPIPPSIRSSLTRAAQIWNDALKACGAPRLVIANAERAGATLSEDRINEVVFLERTWCPPSTPERDDCYDPTRHASTLLRPRRTLGESRDGAVEEADLRVNGVDFRWSPRGEQPGTLSLEALFAHELGHVLGLDHPEEPPSNAIMRPDAAEALAGRELEPLRAEVATICRSHGQDH